MCDLLYPASFAWHHVSKVYPLPKKCSILFIHFYGQVIFHCIDRYTFVCPFIGFDCFHFFAVMTITIVML